ncbi:MAG: hypothetical protein ACP5JG_04320 [Anaerolineae bacterium]
MDSSRCIRYEIKVEGVLDPEWSSWFDSLSLVRESGDPTLTTLSGVFDQSALRGVLNRIWDLNLTLISVVAQWEIQESELLQGGHDG